ncbi:MAG TPA: cysteine--tRNA ligase [Thermomicrobiales bacterium]|nr:cysteine--tRNA ligase [Thermomicrobiales bacterium]
MRVFNTQSQSLEEFTSESGHVGIYVCGVTPYDTTHTGHAFTFLTFDVLVRYLRYQGYEVTYVQNVTDIDDDVLRKARELGTDWRTLGTRETNQYLEDMRNLNALEFDHYVAATEHIAEIIDCVQKLIEAGVAYEVNGNVYFEVSKDPDFGKLSHIPRGEMLPIANERGNFPDDPNKRDPLDFVLWQAAQPDEPTWISPWGEGRPGWHIECSAMSTRYLGSQIDIHGGGYDLIFPHHECEIAQAETAQGVKPFVRYWMHVGMTQYQGEKMSKSLGNLVYVKDLLKTYSSDAIRLYLHAHHYRTSWMWFDHEMDGWEKAALTLLDAAHRPSGSGAPLDVTDSRGRFLAAMENDLSTPGAIAALMDMASQIQNADDDADISGAQATFRELGDLLGLRFA